MTSEYDLLDRARTLDKQAIGELYDKYAPKIYAYLYRRVHDAQTAEDLTGDVFVKFVQAVEDGQSWHTSVRAWLYRVAHNRLIDFYRKQPEEPSLPLDERLIADTESPDSAFAEALSYRTLRSAISQLTQGQQEVLALRFGEQLKSKEVAAVLNKSVGAVEVQQHRALVTLRKILNEQRKGDNDV
jgi:RNA polymerase sigma-70 factor (ECF subfamily)